MFCGCEPKEIMRCLEVELTSNFEDLPDHEDLDAVLTLTPFYITNEQIDNMEEFPGW